MSEEGPKILPGFVFRYFLHEDARVGKLITHHDPMHIHKILGILSLLSFFYRYAFVYPTTGTLGFGLGGHGTPTSPSERFNWLTMLIHTFLAFSSVVFLVPRKRLAEKPMVIYEEYRQHAMIFTLRCFLVFAAATLLPGVTTAHVVSVLVCHLLADRVTRIHGLEGNTAVRATSSAVKISTFYKHVGKLYSLYQFLAIASHILPNAHLGDMGFNTIIAIQSSAFLMTLYRKRIIRGRMHMAIYGFCLAMSTYHILRRMQLWHAALTVGAFVLRINLPRRLSNKYAIWTLFLVVAHWPTAYYATHRAIEMSLSEMLVSANGPATFQGGAAAAFCFFVFRVEDFIRQKTGGATSGPSSGSPTGSPTSGSSPALPIRASGKH